ncbi:MAG: 5,10-methylenetetrahydromethanopterin reductase [Dehalococcoidia bacterium]|nr:MAG: 5,10-methylenetetrahydromethanopterin reductase [Dehalococcoidia bacterium]
MTERTLPPLAIGLSGVGNSPRDIMRLAREFEHAGFAIIGAGDSTFDAFVTCTAIALATEQVTVRTGVALWGRTPVQTVFAAATLDELSAGRFRLGLGPGPKQRSEAWHQVPYDRVVARFRDYVRAIRTAWQGRPGQPVSYPGEFYRFADFALFRPPLTAQLPIDLAANGPQMLRLAGALADRVLLNNMHGGRYLREVAVPTIQEAARRAGRPPEAVKIGGGFLLAIDRDKQRAIEHARRALTYNLALPYNRALLSWYGREEDRQRLDWAATHGTPEQFLAAITDEIVELFAVCGDGDYCRQVVASYGDVLDEASVNTVAWRGADPEAGYRQLLEVFGR